MRIREDQIDWLHPDQVTGAQQTYLRCLEELQELLNRHLYLSFVTQEAHYALYPTQTRYQRHLDQFQYAPGCTVFTISYLRTGMLKKEVNCVYTWQRDFRTCY